MTEARKYTITAIIAVNGRNVDVTDYQWARSGREARAKTTTKYRQLAACSTIQIWDTGIEG